MNWSLKDNNGTQMTEKLSARLEDWEKTTKDPKYENPLFVQTVQLAQLLRTKKNLSREQILANVITEKLHCNDRTMTECYLMNVSKLLQSFKIDKNVADRRLYSYLLVGETTC